MNTYEEIESYALEHNVPIMEKEGITFLINQLNSLKATSVLEIGSAIGYSSLMMASNVDHLNVDTIEVDKQRYEKALFYIHKYHFDQQIHVYLADALTFDSKELRYQYYDCLFIDGAKAQYENFFNKYAPLVNDDGIIVADNLDFHGMVDHMERIKNRNTVQLVKKIQRFRDFLADNEEYEQHYYPVGDGISVITKKKE